MPVRFPLTFNFPPRPKPLPPDGRPPAAGRSLPLPAWARAGANGRWLAAIGTSRWLLPVGIAVGAHALWLSSSNLTVRPRPPAPRLPVTDNTPELLRFSSGARQPVALAASLSTIDLPFGNSLPLPPPPPPLEAGPTTPRRSATPVLPASRTAAGSAGRGGLAWGVPPAASAGLPASASSALELVAQLQSKAGASAAPTAAGSNAAAADAAAPPAAAERPAMDEGQRAASAALARRHLRLGANADHPYRLLWETGVMASNRPESLTDLPQGVELRRLPLAAAQAMGLSQPHAVSVHSPAGLLLLWVQGDQLWLIRQPAGPTRTAA